MSTAAIAETPEIITDAIRLIAADLEQHCRALGRNFLDAGESIPDWVWEDLEWALRVQEDLT